MGKSITLTYLTMGNILKSNSNRIESIVSFAKDKYKLSEDECRMMLPKVKSFYGTFNKKLNKYCRSYKKLFEDPWIHGNIMITFEQKKKLKRCASFGRPQKDFDNCSDRAKRRKVQELCENVSKEQITSAAIRNIKKPVARLVKKMIESNSTEVDDVLIKQLKDSSIPLTEEEALLLLIEAKLSKHQYLLIRYLAASRKANIFPSYQRLLEAKKQCYPDLSATHITEEGAYIELQALLNHTTKRLLESLKKDDVLKMPVDLVLHSKYGCDGAATRSEFKQSFLDNNLSDSSLFMISLVPLQLAAQSDLKMKIWENPRWGSPRYCRPIKFIFAKESRELTVEEIKKVKQQISTLTKGVFSVHGKRFSVTYKLYLTMVDGKVCEYLSDTASSQTCYLCGATPNAMNDISKITALKENDAFFEFGLSPLHAKIRFMELILHLSYNLSFQKWRVSSKEGTDIEKSENKKRIQKEFKDKLGLYIDKVKQGAGTTNDGNMARKFFENTEIVSSITSVDYDFIKRCKIILQTLSSGEDIDPDKFHIYAMKTYALFVAHYEWYKMPSSVHKILLHGSSVIKYHFLPIGKLTEEASEARNKDYRRFREHHTRKFNRTVTNEDVLHMLLISSDPLLSNMRPLTKKKTLDLPIEVKNLLLDSHEIVEHNEVESDIELDSD